MSDLKHLKFTQAGFENFTGEIGKFYFVDGLSTEPIYRVDRDQLSTAFQFAEVDLDGNEQEAGVAARLVADTAARAPVVSFARQTEAERAAEERGDALKAKKPDVELFTRAQLEELAGKHGIKGLRAQVGDKWNVKNRSIPLLIDEILVAQNNWISERNTQIAAATQVEAPVEPKTTDVEGLTDEQLAAAAAAGEALDAEIAKDGMTLEEIEALQNPVDYTENQPILTPEDLAAATGDMGAALNGAANAPADDPVVDNAAGAGASEAAEGEADAGTADDGGAA